MSLFVVTLFSSFRGLRDVIWQFERIASTAKKVEALMAAINDAKSSATKGLLAVLHFGNTRPRKRCKCENILVKL